MRKLENITEQQMFDIITTTFRAREHKIIEEAARYAFSSLYDELRRTGMALRVPRAVPRQIKPDFSLANALVANG